MAKSINNKKEWGCLAERILLPIRGYPAEQYSAHFALYQAEASGATVDVFHVEKPARQSQFDYERIKDWIQKTANALGVTISLMKVQGKSARQEIAKKLKQQPYDLVVIGSRRHRGLLPDFRTSNVVSIAGIKNRPCLVVVETSRDPFEKYRPWKQDRILVLLNECDKLDDVCIRLASTMTSSSSTAHALIHGIKFVLIPDIVPLRAAKDFISEVEEEFLHCIGHYRQHLGRSIEPEIVFGHSEARSIAYLATKRQGDLIIYGVRGSYSRVGLKRAAIWKINEKSPLDCHVAYVFA